MKGIIYLLLIIPVTIFNPFWYIFTREDLRDTLKMRGEVQE